MEELLKKILVLIIGIFLLSSTSALASSNRISLEVGGKTFEVELVDNQATSELKESLKQNIMTIDLRDHGGFEKVGSFGQNFTRNDTTITTEPGDLVLYQGNQLVIFYGTNTYSYTKLGKISNVSQDELRDTLGTGDVSISLSLNSFGEVPNTGITNLSRLSGLILFLFALFIVCLAYLIHNMMIKKDYV